MPVHGTFQEKQAMHHILSSHARFITKSRYYVARLKTSRREVLDHDSSEESKAPLNGFELVLHRSANILLNIADKMSTRVLHLHSEANVATYLGNVSISRLYLPNRVLMTTSGYVSFSGWSDGIRR